MAGDPRVLGLLEEMLSSGKTPEEVCRHCPELLPEVRRRWQQFQLVDAQVRSLLPGLETSSDAGATTPPESVPVPPAAFGRYEVRSTLGAGGFGAVYLGHDTQLDRPVAIKVLHAEARPAQAGESALQEARRLAQLRHPGIVAVHDVGMHEGQVYIVSDYLDGPDLGRWLGDHRPAWPEAARIAAAVADALAHAHARLIVHRDVKPANIILTRRPRPGPRGLRPRPRRGPGGRRREGRRLRHPVRTCRRSRPPARPTASTAAPTSTAWAWCSTRCSPAACRSGRPIARNCCGRCATTSRSPPGSSSATSRPSWRRACLKALAKRQQDRYTTAADFAEDLRRVLPTWAVAELTGPQSGWSASPPISAVKRHSVGRQKELAELGRAFESAAAGQGLFLCVTGEPGIGKTTLVEDFLTELAATGRPCALARGRCSERLAGTEAYLPFLEALESLLHGEVGEAAARVMKATAPTWYAQVVSLTAEDSSLTARARRVESGLPGTPEARAGCLPAGGVAPAAVAPVLR